MSRDFTYIEDIVEGTYLCSLKAPSNYKRNLENMKMSLIKFLILDMED